VQALFEKLSFGTAWFGFLDSMFDSYRPELHYMRGPGPKWRAKHHAEMP